MAEIESELNDWNPLSDHYHDSSNTYITGAGAKLPSHMQPARHRKEDTDYTLFIRPLSTRFTEESLKNIFSNYGHVTDVRIIYPKFEEKEPYGFVTYNSLTAAQEAIRAFNDNPNFEFKVNFSTRDKEKDRERRNNQRSRTDHKNSASEETRSSDDNNKQTEPKMDFARGSRGRRNDFPRRNGDHLVNPKNFNDFTPPSKNISNTGQKAEKLVPDIENQIETSDQISENQQRVESQRNFEEMRNTGIPKMKTSSTPEIKTPSTPVKKEPEVKPSKPAKMKQPMLCSVCQKLTFRKCSICDKSFCDEECGLNGWKNHMSPKCVQLAELITGRATDETDAMVDNNQNVDIRNESVRNAPIEENIIEFNDNQNVDVENNSVQYAPIEEDTTKFGNQSVSFSNVSKAKYAGDHKSIDSAYLEFGNFAKDYVDNKNSFDKPKFNTVYDNNYEENTSNDTSFDIKPKEQPQQQQPYQQRTARPFGQRNVKDNEYSGKDGAYGRPFQRRGDKDGASDHERGSGGPRNYNRDKNRDNRISDDRDGAGSTADQCSNDGRNYDRRSGFDRKKNFNDRPNRQYNQEGGGNYNRRSNDQNNVDIDKNTSAEFAPQAHSSLVEKDSRRQNFGQNEQKIFGLNEIFEVTIVLPDTPTKDTHYIRLAENEGMYQNMMKSLKETSITSFGSFDNTKCVVKYKDEWYRAVITDKELLTVRLVDVGIETRVNKQNLGCLPAEFEKIAPFAVKVQMPSISREKVLNWFQDNSVISVKASNKVDKDRYFIVDVISFEEQLAEVREKNDNVSAPVPPIVKPITRKVSDGPKLPSGKAVKVMVTYNVNETEFFVAFEESLLELHDLMRKEKVIVDKSPPLLEIQEGVLAFADYEGETCRAEIVSKSPVKVKFIDYGNEALTDSKTLKVLSDKFTKIPPAAIRMKLYSGTVASNNVMENQYITITPIKFENQMYVVVVGEMSAAEYASLMEEMEASSVPPTELKPTKPRPSVAMDFYITYAISKREVCGIPKSDVGKLNSLNEKLNQIRPASAQRIEMNKIYGAVYEEILCRARVINGKPLEIFFIDYGNTEQCEATELFELPTEFHHDPPPLAKKLMLQNESSKVLEFGVNISVLWDMETETYELTRDPTDLQSATNQIVNDVNVVAALGDSNYAVILEENRNVYKYINGEIKENLGQLSKPKKIAINEMCLAIFEDETWHRAKIVNLSPLTICFLDFANKISCTYSQLKEIPSYLAEIPPLAFKIKTENYVELKEGSVVKIVMLQEIEHDYWKVATIKDRKDDERKRVEIISDLKHVEKCIKKKEKATPSGNSKAASSSKDTGSVTSDECVKFMPKYQQERKAENKNDDRRDCKDVAKLGFRKEIVGTSKHVPPGPNIVNPFDDTSLVYSVLSNKPKNYPTTVNTLTNGVEHLALADPIRNSTFDDINVPISDHLLDVLHVDDKCLLIIYETFSDVEYTGILICQRVEHLVDAVDRLDKAVENAKCYSAKRGDIVAVYIKGINIYGRAYVVDEPSIVDPFYLVMLFDVGKIYSTDEVYRLSEEFIRVPQCSVRINVTHFQPIPEEVSRLEVVPMNVELIDGDTYQHDKSIYQAKLTKKTETGFEAEIIPRGRKVFHSAQLTKWRPNREEIGVKPVPLMCGDIVKIGHICQTDQCYVMPNDDPINEQRNDFLSKVASHCRKAESIKDDPKIKDIVGVPFMKSYFRGEIMGKKIDSYSVHILDIGIEIKVLKEEMKCLPDNFKFADRYAVRVQLHNVSCTDFNQMSELFLKYIITHEIEFTLEINESTRLIELTFNEEVEAHDMKKGSSFNSRLSHLLTPTWKIESLDFNTPFYLMQLKFEEWPIGAELSLCFVESIDEKSGFMINRYGETYAKLIRVNLNERMREYAEENKESYVPAKDELCIAKFEDKWCRAVCVWAEPGKDLNLQFIDVGFQRQVPHTDIRRMHGDFLKHPATALFCDVENYLDCKSLHDLQGKALKRCKVLKKLEEGGYAIYVCNLRAYALGVN